MTITIRAFNQRESLNFYFGHHFEACIGGWELILAQIKVNSNNRKNVSFFLPVFCEKIEEKHLFFHCLCVEIYMIKLAFS